MYYLDSNVLIYPALYEGPKADGATTLLRAVVSGDVQAATASLTIDEVVWIISREATREDGIDQGERILQMPNLRILDIGGRELLSSVKHLRRYDHLTPHDAIHLAAMTDHGIGSIVTDDDDFDGLAEVDRIPIRTAVDDDGS